MTVKKLPLYILAFVLVGCDSTFDPNPFNRVFLRVFNNSDYHFENVMVNSVSFGTVAKYSFSEYRPFDIAYHYGAVSLRIAGKLFQIIPIDYVGETPLSGGFYTYMLSVDFEAGYLALTFFEGDNLPGQPQN